MSKQVNSEGYVGIYEFAKQTGYSSKHIYEMVRTGKLEAIQLKPYGPWLIPLSVLMEALKVVNISGDSRTHRALRGKKP
jgi:hypothetical protein